MQRSCVEETGLREVLCWAFRCVETIHLFSKVFKRRNKGPLSRLSKWFILYRIARIHTRTRTLTHTHTYTHTHTLKGKNHLKILPPSQTVSHILNSFKALHSCKGLKLHLTSFCLLLRAILLPKTCWIHVKVRATTLTQNHDSVEWVTLNTFCVPSDVFVTGVIPTAHAHSPQGTEGARQLTALQFHAQRVTDDHSLKPHNRSFNHRRTTAREQLRLKITMRPAEKSSAWTSGLQKVSVITLSLLSPRGGESVVATTTFLWMLSRVTEKSSSR